MDILLIGLGGIALLGGLLFSVLPPIPGPPISYLALVALLFHSTAGDKISTQFMLVWGLVVVAVLILDYLMPIWGTKISGGTNAGKWGAILGLFIGLIFLGPFGLIVGPFLGAMLFELASGQDMKVSIKSGIGSFLGFVAGTVLKLTVSIVIAVKFIQFL